MDLAILLILTTTVFFAGFVFGVQYGINTTIARLKVFLAKQRTNVEDLNPNKYL